MEERCLIEPQIKEMGNIYKGETGWESNQRGRVYDDKGIAPTIYDYSHGGGLEPKILTPRRTEYGKQVRKEYENGQFNESRHNMQQLEPRTDGVTNTLTSVQKDNLLMCNEEEVVPVAIRGREEAKEKEVSKKYRIRKLTERECFRLMGLDETEIDTIQAAGISRTQQYKLAGNSVVKDCWYHIMRKLFVEKDNEEQQLTLW